jgi:D-alanyl-D-alanine carboxypeptidase
MSHPLRIAFAGFLRRKFCIKSPLLLALTLLCAVSLLSPLDALAKSKKPARENPKYAAFVMNIDTGEVLHAENADTKRYPASLTKMMTLYLTFEAISQGKLSWNQTLPVSEKAASQPQTNIASRKGERIAVDTLVTSLIVRSANDASYVLAEGIGKTDWNFALMMTKKAKQLGMHHTQFRNPNGLHNSEQYTTARDMAKLGIALKRDFPTYFELFKRSSFSYKGRTYNTHNRVTQHYDGADGVKTGYINASGFNLVTTAHRGNASLVGVVMGGTSGRTRDARMVELLDRSFAQLGAPGPRYAYNTRTEKAAEAPSPFQKNKAARKEIEKSRKRMELARTAPKEASASDGNAPWGIQVGIYNKAEEAVKAAGNAMSRAYGPLASANVVIDPAGIGDADVYRARLGGLSYSQAQNACKQLKRVKTDCFVLKIAAE